MNGLTLDAGALLAVERGHRAVLVTLQEALAHQAAITVPAGALAQVWRGGARQARLASLLAAEGVEVEALDNRIARRAGVLCGATRTRDVIDASVVVGATDRGDTILTSDVDELRVLDPEIELIAV
jgi:hypothetical protein